jgi:hypothetical protein
LWVPHDSAHDARGFVANVEVVGIPLTASALAGADEEEAAGHNGGPKKVGPNLAPLDLTAQNRV